MLLLMVMYDPETKSVLITEETFNIFHAKKYTVGVQESKNQCFMINQTPYSADIALCDYWLLSN